MCIALKRAFSFVQNMILIYFFARRSRRKLRKIESIRNKRSRLDCLHFAQDQSEIDFSSFPLLTANRLFLIDTF